jgi:hypothetical protein
VRATATRPTCVPGGTLPLQVEVVLRRPANIALRKLQLPDGSAPELGPDPLAVNAKRTWKADLRCAQDAKISSPYWLAEPPLPGHHVVRDPRLQADPEGAPPLAATLEMTIDGQPFELQAELLYTFTDRVLGERQERVQVAPPATVTPARDAVLFPNGKKANVALRLRASADGVKGRVLLDLPDGWRSEPAARDLQLAHAGDEAVLSFAVTPPRDAAIASATPVVEVAGQRYSYREDRLGYPHVPPQLILQPAKVRLTPLKLTAPRGLIGYVEGPGDSVAADLAHIGASVEMLDDAALREADLHRFAAIVLGVRAYNTRDVLRAANPRLMRYVEQGGTLIVQYVTRSTISPLDVPVGPYPLEIGRGRVTDETAELHAIDPNDPLLRTPHKIDAADFAGWVQERGLYFGATWDPRYRPVFEVGDPGEPKERGALLVARHGRGRFVYTGLAFFRQLPAGVPGAYRLFLNLLAPSGEPRP